MNQTLSHRSLLLFQWPGMYKAVIVVLLLFVTQNQLTAQIFPKEGSKLYSRIIGFSFPAQSWSVKYKIEIAAGDYNTESSFEKKIINSVSSKSNKIIAEVPSFGSQYTWRIVFTAKDSAKTKSILYHFSTKISPDSDTALTRLRVINSAKKYKDGYVLLDCNRALYDMKGNPVWFLPGTEITNQQAYPRDLKITPEGTITFIAGIRPYEISYDGNILWQHKESLSSQDSETFHHEFTRLANGHYMAIVFENVFRQLPPFKDSLLQNATDTARHNRNVKFNSIIEFDANNQIIWRWNSYDYFIKSDLFSQPGNDGAFDVTNLHENSFYFDETNKTIYLSFRNLNRIIKIKYPEGNVLNTYGPAYKPGISQFKNDLFCNQHSCRLSQKGYLYLFNNNTCSASGIPKIIMMQQPATGKTNLKKVWEYECPVDLNNALVKEKKAFTSGGNVLELPDQSMFVSMGYPYCQTLIVSHDKKILWCAVPEKYNTVEKKWHLPDQLYRASIITRKDLEQLIWNAQK